MRYLFILLLIAGCGHTPEPKQLRQPRNFAIQKKPTPGARLNIKELGGFEFYSTGNKVALEITKQGVFKVKGKKVKSDYQAYKAFKAWLADIGYGKHAPCLKGGK